MKSLNQIFKILSLSLLVIILTNCTSVQDKDAEQLVVYPPQPNPPRIQYLTSLSSPEDLLDKESSFSKFIMGEEGGVSAIIVKPYGVAISDGVVYVVDIRGPGYAYFDLKKKKFDVVYGSLSGKMHKPINMTIDKDGYKYITDTIRSVVLVYDKNNKFVRLIGDGNAFKPSDVVSVENKLYVTDLRNHQIHVIDKKTGDIVRSFGKAGSKNGELFYPTNLAVGINGNIFVSETGNFRVQEFSPYGDYIRTYGKVGTGLGNFARPKGIDIDKQGRMHVVDAAFENVQVIDKSGKLLMFYGEPGGDKHNINLPTDVTIDYDNVKYFKKYADPKFEIEYIILVASQFGKSKVNVYGFGKMQGYDYSESAASQP